MKDTKSPGFKIATKTGKSKKGIGPLNRYPAPPLFSLENLNYVTIADCPGID
jgi:hypothetical protein